MWPELKRYQPKLELKHSMKVLIMEDSLIQATDMVEMLKHMGIESHAVPNAETAFSALETDDFDLVITDMMVSGDHRTKGGGLSLITRLRNASNNQALLKIPIIAVSGALRGRWPNIILRQAYDLGADICVQKPISLQSLQDCLTFLFEAGRLDPNYVSCTKLDENDLRAVA